VVADSNCNVDFPFGFPDFVRFSWGPPKNALKGEGEKDVPIVRWEADEEEEDEIDGGKQLSLDAFVVTKNNNNDGKSRRGSSVIGRRRRDMVFSMSWPLLSKVMKFVDSS
jgi:hypothetical protein